MRQGLVTRDMCIICSSKTSPALDVRCSGLVPFETASDGDADIGKALRWRSLCPPCDLLGLSYRMEKDSPAFLSPHKTPVTASPSRLSAFSCHSNSSVLRHAKLCLTIITFLLELLSFCFYIWFIYLFSLCFFPHVSYTGKRALTRYTWEDLRSNSTIFAPRLTIPPDHLRRMSHASREDTCVWPLLQLWGALQ